MVYVSEEKSVVKAARGAKMPPSGTTTDREMESRTREDERELAMGFASPGRYVRERVGGIGGGDTAGNAAKKGTV